MRKQRTTEAREILSLNDRGTYTVPTNSGLYPAQWNWDSCLVSLGFAQFNLARAWTEIRTLFDSQWPSGMVPHIVFHEDDRTYFPNSATWQAGPTKKTSGITQPPVAAICLRYLYDKCRNDEAIRHLKQLLPQVFRWHRWFYLCRDPHSTGLVSIFHPWESGMDNSPIWDEALDTVPQAESVAHLRKDTAFASANVRPRGEEYNRYLYLLYLFRQHSYDSGRLFPITPFRICDVGFNSIFLRANQDLAYLLRQIGHASDAAEVESWSSHTTAALERCWSWEDKFYCSADSRRNILIRKRGIGGFLPLLTCRDMQQRHPDMITEMRRWLDQVHYGLPSFEPGTREFEPRRYWRGPVWLVVNWLLIEGLRNNGLPDLAHRLQMDSLKLVDANGFWEYFDPRDGTGLGGKKFSWSAAIYLALNAPSSRVWWRR